MYLTDFPEVLAEWNYERNLDLNPNTFKAKSNKKVWWQCSKNKHEHQWQTAICKRTEGSRCPFCIGRKICASNSLATTHPEIARQWHQFKNNTLTPHEVGHGQSIKVWWQCPVASDHEWRCTVNNRTNPHFLGKCPFCIHQKASITNCLATIAPNIAKDWDFQKNKETPQMVFPRSPKKYWWICPMNHSYCASAGNRFAGKGYPYCCNKLIDETNSLQYFHPEVAKEWDQEKNHPITANMVAPASKHKAWWKCSNNENHIWRSSIYDRTGSRKTGCPFCNESKGEKSVARILSKLDIEFEKQFKIEECRNKLPLRFDFSVHSNKNLIGLIEYNGKQHYFVSSFFWKRKF